MMIVVLSDYLSPQMKSSSMSRTILACISGHRPERHVVAEEGEGKTGVDLARHAHPDLYSVNVRRQHSNASFRIWKSNYRELLTA